MNNGETCEHCGKILPTSHNAQVQHIYRCGRQRNQTHRSDERCEVCLKYLPTSEESARRHVKRCESKEDNTLKAPEDRLSDSQLLTLLLRALGGDKVPTSIFENIQQPQRRWSKAGSTKEILFSTKGFSKKDPELTSLITNPERTDTALKSLHSCNQLVTSFEPHRSYSLHEEQTTALSIDDNMKNEWRIKALEIICFIFPRDHFGDIQ